MAGTVMGAAMDLISLYLGYAEATRAVTRWRRSIRCVALVVLAGSLATCNSPTGPGPCVNGVDGLGRGPVYSYNLSCAFVGSDTIQCTNGLREGGYCAVSGLRDVTSITEWSSSNPAAAIVVAPGVLKVTGTGIVQVIGRIGIQSADSPHVYSVAPGTTPERLIKLAVIVQDTASTPRRLTGATVEIEPDRGPPQSCLSNSGLCEFWVFDGRIRARATLQGYEPAEGVAARASQDNPQYQSVTLGLRAMR
jgi:hypothetical protein